MKKIDQIILWILGLGFPVVIGLLIWAYSIVGNNQTLNPEALVKQNQYIGGVWDFLGLFFMGWVVLAVITLFRLLLSPDLRERMLSKVARIEERDEREVEVSGYAAKFSFFANLALLVCLLFFSIFNFHIEKKNKSFVDSNGETRHGHIRMGFKLRTIDEGSLVIKNDEVGKELSYSDLPISKASIIILLIIWQIGTYHLSARKKLKVDE